MSAEGNALQQRLQSAVDSAMDSIDKRKMRGLQKSTYLRIAECFDSKGSSDHVNACVENHSIPMKQAQNAIQNEMNQFQGRIQRCSMDCEDRARDKFPSINANSSTREKENFEKEIMSCMTLCVDKHIALLKTISVKIEGDLDRIASK